MSFAAKLCFEVEGVGAVKVDVVVLCRCQVRRVFVGDGVALGAQRVESVAEVGRGPQRIWGGGRRNSCFCRSNAYGRVCIRPATVRVSTLCQSRLDPLPLGEPAILWEDEERGVLVAKGVAHECPQLLPVVLVPACFLFLDLDHEQVMLG